MQMKYIIIFQKKRILLALNATRRRLMKFQAIFITLLGGASS